MKQITLIDCYTDEPSGLGVPPYLGVYPRYIAGHFMSKGYEVRYMTIDDLRTNFFKKSRSRKTDIRQYNLTNDSSIPINPLAIIGVHTPGKYLSAVPGTIRELSLLKLDTRFAGPITYGTQLEGGKSSELIPKIESFDFSFSIIKKTSILGAQIIKQIPNERVIEIETSRGCKSGRCSFCLEPVKNRFENRKVKDIIEEIKVFYELGCRHFRLGKQSDYYSYDDPIKLLRDIRKNFPNISTLHIDNVNPNSVINDKNHEITKAIVKYCTPGNIAAFGIESFDIEVIKKNSLNTTARTARKAIVIINKYGSGRGSNGMPIFLPGINLILGLPGETKKTFETNYNYLQEIIDQELMLRRINIRQIAIFPNTPLSKLTRNEHKKNKKFHFSFRKKIREKIDLVNLERILPKGTILKNVRTEINDGNKTFARQMGTYPIIVGINEKLPLKEYYDICIEKHMLRSVTGYLLR